MAGNAPHCSPCPVTPRPYIWRPHIQTRRSIPVPAAQFQGRRRALQQDDHATGVPELGESLQRQLHVNGCSLQTHADTSERQLRQQDSPYLPSTSSSCDNSDSNHVRDPAEDSVESPRPIVLDVRNAYEWDAGHFQGAARPLGGVPQLTAILDFYVSGLYHYHHSSSSLKFNLPAHCARWRWLCC